MTEHHYTDAALAGFYELENNWAADFDYCVSLAETAGSVLDLGCGTGQLATHLARTRRVTGVDPAEGMLTIARTRPGGDRVQWVLGKAQTVRLGQRFDLIVLTGHAFQVFLTAADQAAVLATIAHHLSPEGRFIFDTRTPQAMDLAEWNPPLSNRRVEHPDRGPIDLVTETDTRQVDGIVAYTTHYHLLREGRRLAAVDRLVFPSQQTIARRIAEAGLTVDRWLGDWRGSPWSPAAKDIIPLGRLAP